MHTNAKRGKMKTQKKTRRENEPNNEHAVKKQKAEIKKTHTNAKTGKMKTQKETGSETSGNRSGVRLAPVRGMSYYARCGARGRKNRAARSKNPKIAGNIIPMCSQVGYCGG